MKFSTFARPLPDFASGSTKVQTFSHLSSTRQRPEPQQARRKGTKFLASVKCSSKTSPESGAQRYDFFRFRKYPQRPPLTRERKDTKFSAFARPLPDFASGSTKVQTFSHLSSTRQRPEPQQAGRKGTKFLASVKCPSKTSPETGAQRYGFFRFRKYPQRPPLTRERKGTKFFAFARGQRGLEGIE